MATTRVPDESAVQTLEGRLSGDLLFPDDPEYDESRTVWNGMVDRYPSMVVRCRGASDVVAAVDFARENDLLLSVKGGGHSVAGHAVCDDGLLLDLSEMDDVRVDPAARTARVGPGARWAAVDHESQAFGLATPGGTVSDTGVAGLTLGGGIGFLSRTYGLACDNLVSADVVTAAGDLVRVSETENPDLFWAIRGGGGNFGVVTSFEFQLHEVGPDLLAGPIFYDVADAPDVLRFYRKFMADAPDEVACYAAFLTIPPMEPFPETHHGATGFALVPCYSGDVADGEEALRPLREFGEPLLDGVAPIPYTALQQSFDEGAPAGERYYFKSQYMADLPDEAIDTMVEYADPLPAPFTTVFVESMGGAIAAVDEVATPYPHRAAAYNFSVFGGWSDPEQDEEVVAWTREFHEAMAPFSTGGAYANYLDTDEDDRVRAAYGPNYDRLAEIKATWDPENLFSQNKNVAPEGRV